MSRTEFAKLGDVAAIRSGIGFPLHLQGRNRGKYPFAKVGDISKLARSGRSDLTRADNFVEDSDLLVLKAQVFPEGTVIFAKIGEAIRKSHRAIVVSPCLIDNNAMGVTPGPKLTPRYLYHFLRTIDLYPLAQSTAVPSIRKSDLERLGIPCPSLTRQRGIAQVLDHVDALRAKRREAIALLDDLAESVFLGMFGGPESSWPQVTVNDVALDRKGAIRTGPFGSQLLHDEFVDSGVAVLGIDNAVGNEFKWQGLRFITEEKYGKLARYTVHPGDVLITIMGTCGRCAVVPDDIPVAINTKHLCCITLDRARCLPEFLHSYFLMHPESREYLRKNAKGAIMAGLNMGIIKELPIALPPRELQETFVARIKAIRALKLGQSAHLAELDALFASLQHRAFRSELWPESPAPAA